MTNCDRPGICVHDSGVPLRNYGGCQITQTFFHCQHILASKRLNRLFQQLPKRHVSPFTKQHDRCGVPVRGEPEPYQMVAVGSGLQNKTILLLWGKHSGLGWDHFTSVTNLHRLSKSAVSSQCLALDMNSGLLSKGPVLIFLDHPSLNSSPYMLIEGNA